MHSSQLRKLFLDFFAQREHRVMRSDPLIPPADDKSLLFTGAGMNQFKNEFMGRGEPGLTRAVTSQKCLRTGDIDNVGRTAFHNTFFEMLGNFSFGDYFKRESILWAWEFLVDVLEIPPEKLRVSIYEDDDESFAIWRKEIGLSPEIIHRFGQHDNFWPADCPKQGPNGLCGPCTEIFYDFGEDVGCGRPECNPSCDCGRFCEVWNLVLQQYERKDGGVLEPLPTRNIDTGMGFERLVTVMQGKRTIFDTDLFAPIIQAIERETDQAYEPVRDTRAGMAFRRIADHVRAAVFCIGDGILPGNTGRGYVLRKLLRRAVLDGRRLGMHEPFLYRLTPVVTHIMGDQYPEIVERRENAARLIRMEEERFLQTLDQGMGILNEMIKTLRDGGGNALSGADAFKLFDTYGLPIDVTESILEDEELSVDKPAFEEEMERQRALSRQGAAMAEDIFGGGPAATLREQGCASEFTGYNEDVTEAEVSGIIQGEELVEEAAQGTEAVIVLERTPFYGEAGGEVGDTGALENAAMLFEVRDTKRSGSLILHVGTVRKGVAAIGDTLLAKPDPVRRADIRRNHTATHLLHHALREVLGPHAEQAGSYVGPKRLRFDFTHMQAMTLAELRLAEDIVNRNIIANAPVRESYTSLEQAREQGAMALFGEKSRCAC